MTPSCTHQRALGGVCVDCGAVETYGGAWLGGSGKPANVTQVGGDHYRTQPIQPWDYIAANGLGFFEGNVVKYVSRHRQKGGVEDLRKARHYLDKLIELELANAPTES